MRTGAVRARQLVADVFPDHGRIGLERLQRVHDHGQFLVFHFHQFGRVGRDVAIVGDDERDFLVLEHDFLVGEHRLDIARERGHPVQLERLEIVRRQHRVHARVGESARLVDFQYPRMRVWAAHHRAEQHAGHLDVVDIGALALDEARILTAFARAAHTLQRGETIEIGIDISHYVSPDISALRFPP